MILKELRNLLPSSVCMLSNMLPNSSMCMLKLIHVHAVKYAAKLIHTRRALSNAIITLIRSQCQAKPAILLITIDLFRYTFVFLLACGGGKLQCSVGTRLAPSACLDDRGVLFSLRCCELWCRGRLKTGRLKK